MTCLQQRNPRSSAMSMRLPPWWLDVEHIAATAIVRFVRGAPLSEEAGYLFGQYQHEAVGHVFANYLRSLVEEGNCRRLVISFGHVGFLDSMLIGKLVALHRILMERDGRLALCDVNTQLNEVLEIVRLPLLISVF